MREPLFGNAKHTHVTYTEGDTKTAPAVRQHCNPGPNRRKGSAMSNATRITPMWTTCPCGADHRQAVLDRVGIMPSGCWEASRLNREGYGLLTHSGRTWLIHRLAYVAWIGEIPQGLVIDHLCRNRACANPAHLEAVTDRVNILRGEGVAAQNARKQTCPEGHQLMRGARGRRCRECSYYDENKSRALANPLPEGDERHGTVNGYNNWRCRCEACSAAGARFNAAAKQERRKRGLPEGDGRHGTVNGYTNWGCRCTDCKAAVSKSSQLPDAGQAGPEFAA